MAERVVHLVSAAALCLLLHLFAVPTAAAGGDAAPPATGPSLRTAISEYVLLVGKPSVSVYAPLDSGAGAGAMLLNDTDAVPEGASCAHFKDSVYCVGGNSVKTWRFDRVNGSPLPPGPDLHRDMKSPGTGRMANINNEWLVTCGDWRSEQPNTICQVLHVNAGHWVEIESEACGCQSAVAEHNGSVFVAGGWCEDEDGRRVTAAVWSLRISQTAGGNDTFQWHRHPDMSTPRDELAIASHNGYLYACGGWFSFGALSICERWREGMHSWQSIAPLPQPRYRLQMLSVDGRLIAMGGRDGGEYKRDVFDYDEAEDAWSRLHDMPVVNLPGPFGSAVVPAL